MNHMGDHACTECFWVADSTSPPAAEAQVEWATDSEWEADSSDPDIDDRPLRVVYTLPNPVPVPLPQSDANDVRLASANAGGASKILSFIPVA